MAMKSGVFGIKKVVANMNKAVVMTHEQTQAGLIEAAIYIRQDMAKNSPKVPVHHRNLDASFYIVAPKKIPDPGGGFSSEGEGPQMAGPHSSTVGIEQGKVAAWRKPAVGIGFTAFYATYVHEMPSKYNFRKEGSGPKFLESAMIRSEEEVKSILKGSLIK